MACLGSTLGAGHHRQLLASALPGGAPCCAWHAEVLITFVPVPRQAGRTARPLHLPRRPSWNLIGLMNNRLGWPGRQAGGMLRRSRGWGTCIVQERSLLRCSRLIFGGCVNPVAVQPLHCEDSQGDCGRRRG